MHGTSNFESPPVTTSDLDVAALVISVDSVPSTNDVARSLLTNPAFDIPHLTTVIARAQTNGRGRLGRTWATLPDRSLASSTIVRLDTTPGMRDSLAWVIVAQALATRSVLAQRLVPLGHRVEVKWPNDVVVDGSRKIAGILAEVVTLDDEDTDVVIGTGVNVSMRRTERPTPQATALSLEGDRKARTAPAPVIQQVLASQLRAFDARLDALVRADGNAARAGLLQEFRAHCATLGQPVVVRDAWDPGPIHPTAPTDPAVLARTGLAVAINDDASLAVETPDGRTHTVRTGDVELLVPPLPAPPPPG